jgi:hypothetical protein
MKEYNKLSAAFAISLLAIDDQYSYNKGEKAFTNISKYQLKRFLDDKWDENFELEKYIKSLKIDWTKGWLSIDDVLLEKPHSQKIEGVYWLYSSKTGKSELGLNVTVLTWCDGKQIIPIKFMVYEKDENDKPLQTKNNFAEESIKYAHKLGVKPMYVNFDSKYPSNNMLNILNNFNWTYYTQLPSNRLFNDVQLKNRKFHLLPEEGKLEGVGHKVSVIKHCKRYYVTNAKLTTGNTVSRQQILNNYGTRWSIEEFFRALKQLCHLKECKSRSIALQRRYIMLTFRAFMMLQDQKQSSVYEAKIYFQRKFLGKKLNGNKALRQIAA